MNTPIQFSTPNETAQALSSAAISFVPIKIDGSKAASVEWKQYQQRLPTANEVHSWFGNGATRGIATICGDVSGGLEVIDLDAPDLREDFEDLVKESCPGLFERLLVVQTPKDGRHYIFRSTAVQGNQKLARRKIGNENKVMIETRGEGGYVVAPGSPSKCHPLNKPYLLIQGSYLNIPQLTRDERASLFDCARSFNEILESVNSAPSHLMLAGMDKPGADFNAQATSETVAEMLLAAGWTRLNRRSKYGQMWRRPGKKDPGGSATLCNNGALTVFSTNAYPFEDGKAYSPFAVLALTQFNGDFSATAKALAAEGYGEQRKQLPQKNAALPQADGEKSPSIAEEQRLFAPSDTLLRPSELTVMGLAARFHERYYETTRYVEVRNRFYNYERGLWHQSRCGCEVKTKKIINELHDQAQQAEQKMLDIQKRYQAGDASLREALGNATEYWEVLVKFLSKIKTPIIMTQILEFAKSDLLIEADAFDCDPSILNLKNGTIDLDTGNFREHRSEDLCSMQTSIAYDPDARAPHWLGFLRDIFISNQELIDFVQRAVGYSLSGHTSEQVFFILHGDGANGKGALFRILSQMLGGYITNANVDTFMDEKPGAGGHNEDIARLRGARLVTTTETEKSKRLAEGLVKRLTGEDKITASFKHERSFEFTPRFKMWLAANYKPNITGTDSGIWRRIILIPFDVEFVKPLVTTLGPKQRYIDPLLEPAMARELPGILNWAIDGYREWRKQGLKPPKIVQDAGAQYRSDSDRLGNFLEDHMLQVASEPYASLAETYKVYRKWAEEGGFKVSSIRGLSADLKQRGIEVSKQGKGNVTTVVGYGLLDKA